MLVDILSSNCCYVEFMGVVFTQSHIHACGLRALLKKVMADQNIVNHNAKSGGPQSMSVAESGSSAKTKTGKKKNLSSPSPPAKKRKVSGETVSEEENPIG